MKLDYYPFREIEQVWVDRYYEFVSVSKYRSVAKGLGFQKIIERPGYAHCLFGDVHEKLKLDTNVVTNNGDTDKVLMTIAMAAKQFLADFPACRIILRGESRARLRLYRIFINKNSDVIHRLVGTAGAIGDDDFFEEHPVSVCKNFDFLLLSHVNSRAPLVSI